jgi:hypothetical protein
MHGHRGFSMGCVELRNLQSTRVLKHVATIARPIVLHTEKVSEAIMLLRTSIRQLNKEPTCVPGALGSDHQRTNGTLQRTEHEVMAQTDKKRPAVGYTCAIAW